MIQCVQQILEGGKPEYWHSKSIPKLKLELPTYLVQKLDILPASAFYKKIYLCPISFKWHIGNLFSSYEGWSTTVTMQVYFWRILQLSSIHEFQGPCRCPKSAEYNSCTATVVAQHPYGLQRFSLCYLKDNGQSYIFLQNAHPYQKSSFWTRWIWSSNLGFVMLFSAITHPFPPSRIWLTNWITFFQ